ncbi:MAG TPA: hypothetical protein VK611_18895 [Acidimicrobiales bacterium]|nr:hypothetical protein [Acidimicrobiales bacterium]
MALALKIVGVADDVEFLATLLVAPVIVATLVGDRNLGYVAAGVAAVAYLSLRFEDVQDAGAIGVVILVVFRAGSYGFVAYVTPLLFGRLTGDAAPAGIPARHLRAEVVDPWAAAADEVDLAPVLSEPESAWAPDDELDDDLVPAGAESQFARAWQDEAPLDEWADEPLAPPAPRVPTGWIDDATSPLGDETIPVGFTGELFLGRLTTGSTPIVRSNGNGHGHGHGVGTNGGATQPQPPPAPPLQPLQPGYDAPTARQDPPAGRYMTEPPPEPVRRRQDAAWGAAPPSAEDTGPPGPPGGPGGRRHERAQSRPHVAHDPSGGIDPETRLWNAQFFRDRLTSAVEHSRRSAHSFSVVMIQVADEPFQPLPYRRQVALLRELGHQFVPRFVDHLVHLPDGAQHWFAVVLVDTDRTAAGAFEHRLRATIAGYLKSRGLRVGELQSASLTSPDDDEAMASIWASLLGADPSGVDA